MPLGKLHIISFFKNSRNFFFKQLALSPLATNKTNQNLSGKLIDDEDK